MVIRSDSAIDEIEKVFRWRIDAQERWSRDGWGPRGQHEIQRELDAEGFERIRKLLRQHGSLRV